MSATETYYLIDYENVGVEGFSGCERLSKADHILIFFTKNAKKIDMSEIANHGNAELEMIEVPAGKQSADIHIGSYVSYLAGTIPNKEAAIVVISKDTDFDNVIRFWKEKTGIRISRIQTIKSRLAQMGSVTQAVTLAKKAPRKAIPVTSENKTALNMAVQKAMSAANYNNKIISSVASLVVAHFGEEDMTQAVQEDIRAHFKNDVEIFSVIKPILVKYSGVDPVEIEQSKSTVNVIIQQTLSKAGFENKIIGTVASLVVKNIGKKNSKQTIYRQIISTYGQKKGLEIYNQIKSCIP